MNQSDIRGLSVMDRADIDILRHELCFLQTRVQQQKCLSQARVAYHSYRACTCQYQPYFQFSGIKEQLRRKGDKRNIFYHAAFFLFFRASYSIIADHMNPANSLATAVTALQGSLPLLTSLR
jgi:hypothetical protein